MERTSSFGQYISLSLVACYKDIELKTDFSAVIAQTVKTFYIELHTSTCFMNRMRKLEKL